MNRVRSDALGWLTTGLLLVFGALAVAVPSDTGSASTTCWHNHWQPSGCDAGGDLREVGKTWVVRKFIIGDNWGW